MKRFLLSIALILCLVFGINNFAIAKDDIQAIETISQIGTLANSGNYMQALDKCNEALKKYPKESDLYYWKASIQNSINQKREALENFNKAIALNPKEGTYYIVRGICKMDLEDYKGAEADFNKAIELNPNDGTAYTMRGCAKLSQGNIDGANNDLTKANQLFDQDEDLKKVK